MTPGKQPNPRLKTDVENARLEGSTELPEFVVLLKSLARLSKFQVGTIGFHAWTMFLFSTDEAWGHPGYALSRI